MKVYIVSYSNEIICGQFEIKARNYKHAFQWAKRYGKENGLRDIRVYLYKKK